MSCLIKATSKFDLLKMDRSLLIENFCQSLSGRVQAAYLFGSFATGDYRSGSDIDLILISETQLPFTKRGMEFADLFDIYPALDLLVYTQDEFDRALEDPQGFWLSVKKSLNRIL